MQKDKTKQETGPDGVRAEHSQGHEASTTAQTPGGDKAQVKEGHHTSTAVEARPNGDVKVEQKEQHAEQRKTN